MRTDTSKLNFNVWIKGETSPYVCASDEKVLSVLEREGQKKVRIGCRQGGCGACRVKVLSGTYETAKMSRAHVTPEEAAQGYALSCRLFPRSDLVIEPAFVGPRRSKQEN